MTWMNGQEHAAIVICMYNNCELRSLNQKTLVQKLALPTPQFSISSQAVIASISKHDGAEAFLTSKLAYLKELATSKPPPLLPSSGDSAELPAVLDLGKATTPFHKISMKSFARKRSCEICIFFIVMSFDSCQICF